MSARKKETLNVTIGGKVKTSDITMMTRQFATLINANIPIVETLDVLSEQVENERLKMILTEAKQKVNEGSSIADALLPHTAVFTPLYINMIRAGEAWYFGAGTYQTCGIYRKAVHNEEQDHFQYGLSSPDDVRVRCHHRYPVRCSHTKDNRCF